MSTFERHWYTPAQYPELARKVMGAIDLDPCSDDIEQGRVQAESCLPISANSLTETWRGRVWLAPPLPCVAAFIEKLLVELELGNVSEAVVLAPNYTDTKWFHRAARLQQPICFTKGRIKFLTRGGSPKANGPANGQAFFYFGDNKERFRQHFQAVGFIRPRPK